jgi:hypothetical protein
MKNQNAKKEITRDQTFKIKMSKEEKELLYEFAKDMGVNPSRLARNLLLEEAERKLRNKIIFKPILNAYRNYLKVTKQNNILERMKED